MIELISSLTIFVLSSIWYKQDCGQYTAHFQLNEPSYNIWTVSDYTFIVYVRLQKTVANVQHVRVWFLSYDLCMILSLRVPLSPFCINSVAVLYICLRLLNMYHYVISLCHITLLFFLKIVLLIFSANNIIRWYGSFKYFIWFKPP